MKCHTNTLFYSEYKLKKCVREEELRYTQDSCSFAWLGFPSSLFDSFVDTLFILPIAIAPDIVLKERMFCMEMG